jgi:hypothetical protein
MMPPMRSRPSFLLGVVLVLSAACQKSGGGDSLYAQTDSPENLKGLLETIVASAGAGDHKKAAALTRGLIPDQAALGKALRDDAPPELAEGLLAMGKNLPADDAVVAGLIKPGEPARTQVNVHGATTEEIAAYEGVEPGKDSGMKYHLFFFDGARWRMLGPAWRGLK